MVEPTVVDARGGLSQDALAYLRRATRVQVGIKNAVTIVLGCWVEATAAEWAAETPVALVIRNGRYSPIPARPRMLFEVPGPARAEQWRDVVERLRPGDTLSLGRGAIGAGQVELQLLIQRGQARPAKVTLTLPTDG